MVSVVPGLAEKDFKPSNISSAQGLDMGNVMKTKAVNASSTRITTTITAAKFFFFFESRVHSFLFKYN